MSFRRVESRSARAVTVAAHFLVTACSRAPEPVPPAPILELPERFTAVEAAGEHRPLRWWTTFGSPTLDALLDTALAANLDLVEASSRVAEVRAQARIVGADRFPSVDMTASVSESRSPSNSGFGEQLAQLLGGLIGDTTGLPADGDGVRRISTTTYSAALGASYELDLFGRIGHDVAAAARELRASEADARTVRLSVLAETIRAYFELRDLQERRALTATTVDVLAERENLTEDRYNRGLASSFELHQVRQELRNAEATLPRLETGVVGARSRLAVLLGRYPADLEPLLGADDPGELPTDPVPAGLPAALLSQRPDVRAAAERYEAARLRVGARRAELFPRLTLSGSLGLQSSEAGSFFDLDQWTSNLVAGLAAPLFQGGRLRANVSAAEARYAQAGAAFGRSVLTAVGETEVSLQRYRDERERYAFLRSQLDEAQASRSLLASRYRSGVSGYLDYLDAVRNQLNVQTTLSTAGRDLALALLGVHRALGGGWVEEPADTDEGRGGRP